MRREAIDLTAGDETSSVIKGEHATTTGHATAHTELIMYKGVRVIVGTCPTAV